MDLLKAVPISLRLVFRDPINFLLALIPTIIAITIYVLAIVWIFQSSDYFGVFIRNYIPDQQAAGWVGRLLVALFLIFFFLIMSWTFIVLVGIIAAPFNSMLSSRIEKILTHQQVSIDRKQTFQQVLQGLGQTFLNEFKKLFLILSMTIVALILNLVPLLYPIGVFLLSLLLAVQFIDYSWSRHEISFGLCLKDAIKNIIPYSISGFLFLLLVTVPIINALVPALATAYYTVLWLHRQNMITEFREPQRKNITIS
jgi:CysZ protein